MVRVRAVREPPLRWGTMRVKKRISNPDRVEDRYRIPTDTIGTGKECRISKLKWCEISHPIHERPPAVK